MIVLNLLLIVVLIGFGLLDRKKIKSLEKMAQNRERYIALLEKRNREDRIFKNEQLKLLYQRTAYKKLAETLTKDD